MVLCQLTRTQKQPIIGYFKRICSTPVALVDGGRNIRKKHPSIMIEPQQMEYAPRCWIKILPITAPDANAITITEEIYAVCLSAKLPTRPQVIALCIAERRLPMHMVVATFASSIFRKAST